MAKILIVDISKCGHCGSCIGVCSKGVLELAETFLQFEKGKQCNNCGICVKICPVDALELMETADYEKKRKDLPHDLKTVIKVVETEKIS